MSFSIGIIGLPNVGKSTLFKSLTQQEVDISNYPFCTINPNIGIVQVPDQRLEKLSKIIQPEKTTLTVIEFVDIAGLVKGAHKGEGLGNQFLANIREVDAILHVIRSFTNKDIKHVEDSIDTNRDIETINMELIMKDLETIEKHKEKLEKEIKANSKDAIKENQLLEKIKSILNQGQFICLDEKEKQLIKHLNLLTIKPVIYIINSKGTDRELQAMKTLPENTIPLDLKMELEYSDLTKQELEELKIKPRLDILIKTCYKILNLISFYTIKGGTEVRAWTAKQNTLAPKAGGIVHTDFEDKFIKADIINYNDLIKTKSWNEAKNKGLIKTQGKTYEIKDGDIIEFKI